MTSERRTAVRVAVASIVVLVVAGAIVAAVLISRPSHRAGPAPTAGPASQPSTYSGDLRQLLLVRPATAQSVADPITTDGVLTFDQAALITHPEEDSKAQLRSFAYQRGAAVQWREGDVEVIVRLFQFASADKATGYQDALDGTFAPNFFDEKPLPGTVTGGHAYVSNRPLDGRGYLGTATATQGTILMIVSRYQPTADAGPVIDLAVSQYARLP